ncbi:MAG TPA: FGGY family carbohydrate kinase [Mobilitalea sp.]|nr:FGGY family carbohydrate kinase [Mobilitalea sp.]
MGSLYLVADINEKGGCHVLGRLENGILKLEEVYRFEIKQTQKNGKNLWDLNYIFEQIKEGIANCKKIGKLPVLVGITAFDNLFVLLDQDNKVIDDMIFNLDDIREPETFKIKYLPYIEKAKCFLMLADYFCYLLTGRMQCNCTYLVPIGLVSKDTLGWNDKCIEKMGLDKLQLPPVSRPGNVIGNLTYEITDEIGYDFIIMETLSRQAAAAIFNTAEKDIGDDNIDIQQLDKSQPDRVSISDELKSIIGCLCILFIVSHELKDMEVAVEIIRKFLLR